MAGKNKTRLVGWHPSDPAAVAWLDAEIARRGGGRGVQSAILDDALGKAMANPLTVEDRDLIAEMRRVGPVLRRRDGIADKHVGWLLAEAADRLEGRAAAQAKVTTETGTETGHG